MNGGVVLQLALDTLATAAIFAIVGMAVLIAHSGTRVLHLAIGEVAMAGALVAAGLAGAVAGVAGRGRRGRRGRRPQRAGERALVAPVVRRVELAAILLLAAGVVVRELLRGLYSRSAYAFPSVGGEFHPGRGDAARRRPRHRGGGRGDRRRRAPG